MVKDAAGSETTRGRSGNPGYINGLPVLLGKADSANAGAKLVYQGGFEVRGADVQGQCFAESRASEVGDLGDPIINFGEDLSYACSKALTLAELQQGCTSGALLPWNHEIFKSLNEATYFGMFGNANIHLEKDWARIAESD